MTAPTPMSHPRRWLGCRKTVRLPQAVAGNGPGRPCHPEPPFGIDPSAGAYGLEGLFRTAFRHRGTARRPGGANPLSFPASGCLQYDSALYRNRPVLAAIVIYWNTVRLGEAVRQRKRAGLPVEPELLAHISPLGWAPYPRDKPRPAPPAPPEPAAASPQDRWTKTAAGCDTGMGPLPRLTWTQHPTRLWRGGAVPHKAPAIMRS